MCVVPIQLGPLTKWQSPTQIQPEPRNHSDQSPNLPQPIKHLQPSKAHRYLGMHLTSDGNYQKELLVFSQCNNCFIQLLHSNPFSHHEICTIYLQCYLPTVGYYPLPATNIPSHWLHNVQKQATLVFLMKFGYPCTYPRAITYATTDHGGLGFQHLGHEAHVQQSLQMIKHLWLNTSIG